MVCLTCATPKDAKVRNLRRKVAGPRSHDSKDDAAVHAEIPEIRGC